MKQRRKYNKEGERKTHVLTYRMTPTQHAALKRAADAKGKSLMAYLEPFFNRMLKDK